MNEDPGERRSSGGGLITNPAIVKSALSNQQQQKAPAKRSGKKNTHKSTTSTLEAISVTTSSPRKPSEKRQPRPKSESKAQPQQAQAQLQTNKANANKPRSEGSAAKPKPKKGNNNQQVPKKKSPPGTPKQPSGEDPDIELKKILYPDLFGAPSANSNGPSGSNGGSNPANSANSTPRKKNGQKRAVSTPAEKGFAGSSFSSSPAPSALPKPSFGPKQSTPEASASSGSLFEQFMMADRQERMNKSSSIAANH
ncbi:hypothetical protein TRVA0_027S01750 [Trichomonascus vanleenenianus]|uniref:uncharacterized protein n=1 Tax=Trichomonascus vanleenenianus TaxID=2268995 RepID=UPI003ECA7092